MTTATPLRVASSHADRLPPIKPEAHAYIAVRPFEQLASRLNPKCEHLPFIQTDDELEALLDKATHADEATR